MTENLNPCLRDSIKERKFADTSNTYIISAHGHIIQTKDQRDYFLTIPSGVNLYTYTDIKERLQCDKHIQYNTCNINEPIMKTPILIANKDPKYKYSSGEFPNLYFFPDHFLNIDKKLTKSFYSGIVHCESNCIIYNIDDHPKKKCKCENIFPLFDKVNIKPYSCKKYFCNPQSESLDAICKEYLQKVSCGPISLSSAIDIIQYYNKKILHNEKPINIHLLTCLNVINTDTLIASLGTDTIVGALGLLPSNTKIYDSKDYHSTLLPNKYTLYYGDVKVEFIFDISITQEDFHNIIMKELKKYLKEGHQVQKLTQVNTLNLEQYNKTQLNEIIKKIKEVLFVSHSPLSSSSSSSLSSSSLQTSTITSRLDSQKNVNEDSDLSDSLAALKNFKAPSELLPPVSQISVKGGRKKNRTKKNLKKKVKTKKIKNKRKKL